MKMFLFASALALSTAAIAQDATTAPAAPPADPAAAAPAAPDASTMPATAPDASAPAATAPAMPDPAGSGASAASSTDDSNLPMCSKTVTDKCKQGAGGGHKAMHHKKK
jgi:hypothetical protein